MGGSRLVDMGVSWAVMAYTVGILRTVKRGGYFCPLHGIVVVVERKAPVGRSGGFSIIEVCCLGWSKGSIVRFVLLNGYSFERFFGKSWLGWGSYRVSRLRDGNCC